MEVTKHRHNWIDVSSKESTKIGLALWACEKCHEVASLSEDAV